MGIALKESHWRNHTFEFGKSESPLSVVHGEDRFGGLFLGQPSKRAALPFQVASPGSLLSHLLFKGNQWAY